MNETLQGTFAQLLKVHNEMVVQSVLRLLEHNSKWIHSGLSELGLDDDLRVRLLALRARLQETATEPEQQSPG